MPKITKSKLVRLGNAKRVTKGSMGVGDELPFNRKPPIG